jgi:hypothetical protein
MEGRSDQPDIPGDFRTYAPLRIASDGRRKSFDTGGIADLRIITRALREEDVQLAMQWPRSMKRVRRVSSPRKSAKP